MHILQYDMVESRREGQAAERGTVEMRKRLDERLHNHSSRTRSSSSLLQLQRRHVVQQFLQRDLWLQRRRCTYYGWL